MNFPTKSILVYDIETDSTDPFSASLKFLGAYSYITNKRYYYEYPRDYQEINELFANHDVVVGFNNKSYDDIIMGRHGVSVRGMINIDLYEIIAEAYLDTRTRERRGGKGRGLYMGLNLNSWSLANIVAALELGEYKQDDFDYSILKKHEFTIDERKLILDYLEQDITITKRLFEYTHNFFAPLMEYLSEENQLRFNHMTSSVAALSYKIICHQAGLPETYADNTERTEYPGGFVFKPRKKNHVGTILCLDFNSLYPSIFRCFNLTVPANEFLLDRDVFKGNELFEVIGQYNAKEYGVIEQVLGNLYAQRKEFKAVGDRREYLIKIIINSFYGASANPVFEQIYNPTAAADCTAIGRQMVKFAAKYLEEHGIEFLYGDTDSCYVALNGKSIEDTMVIVDEIVSLFKSNMPFPNDDFGFGIDAVITGMWFVPKKNGGFLKKNYVYIEQKKDGTKKLSLKGLPIIKSNASKVALAVFKKHLEAQILAKNELYFEKRYLEQLIFHELKNDISLAVQGFKVRPTDEYKSTTSLSYQISDCYGEGYIELIPNLVFGIGKAKKYCTLKEFEEKELSVEDIDLTVAWSNLEPFVLMCDECGFEPVEDYRLSLCLVCSDKKKQTSLGDFL